MDKSSEAYLFLKRRSGREMDNPFLMQFNKKLIQAKAEGRTEFLSELRRIAIQVIALDDVVWVRKGIHSLAVVGQAEDVQLLKQLLNHSNPQVVKDAKTAIFELTHNH